MFRKSIAIAETFTFPVVLSRKTIGGECSSAISTFVMVNSDGWFVTAGHVLRHWRKLQEGVEQTKKLRADLAAINADTQLSGSQRKKKINQVPRAKHDDTERCSAWWSKDEAKLLDYYFIDLLQPDGTETMDIGAGRLENFQKLDTYPTFKDPSKNFQVGTSLCKLGFPFHAIKPTWDEDRESFMLRRAPTNHRT